MAEGKGGPGRLGGVQCLRALAALLVLASHLRFFESQVSADRLLPAWFDLAGGSGVDLFFVISGFVMVYVTRGAFGRARHAAVFLYNRAARIYPPLWLFAALAVIGFGVFGGDSAWLTGKAILFTALLLPAAEPPVLGVAWTLVHEVYFYLVFAIFLLGPARLLPRWLAVWVAAIVAGQVLGWHAAGPAAALWLHPMTLEFIAGCAVGLLVCGGRRRFAGGALLAGALWLPAAWALVWTVDAPLPLEWMRTLCFGPAAALMVYGAVGLETDRAWAPPRAGVLLGDWSYALYLSHVLVLTFLSQVWARFAAPGSLIDNLLWIPLGAASCLIVAAVAYYGFERPVLRAAARGRRRLFGSAPLPPRPDIADRIW